MVVVMHSTEANPNEAEDIELGAWGIPRSNGSIQRDGFTGLD